MQCCLCLYFASANHAGDHCRRAGNSQKTDGEDGNGDQHFDQCQTASPAFHQDLPLLGSLKPDSQPARAWYPFDACMGVATGTGVAMADQWASLPEGTCVAPGPMSEWATLTGVAHCWLLAAAAALRPPVVAAVCRTASEG